MASIAPYKDGYRAQVFVAGVRKTKTFRTKREAAAWAASLETDLRSTAALSPGERYTLREAIEKYSVEVVPTHKGAHWELLRLEKMKPHLPLDKPIAEVTPNDIGNWRDIRLGEVRPASVLREIKILGSLFETVRVDWRWIKTNPVADVRKPRSPKHRTRLISWTETKGMLREMGYSPRRPIKSATQAVGVMFLVALRTGMRAGELCDLEWREVQARQLRVVGGKTDNAERDVPLTRKTNRLLAKMAGWDKKKVFGINPSSRDTLFRKCRERAGLEGFTFHDSRHTAATRISRKVDVLTLCKIFGWSDPKQAMVYYNPTAVQIADQLE